MTEPKFRPTDVHSSRDARQGPATGPATARARCATGASPGSVAHEAHARRVAVSVAEQLRQVPSPAVDLDEVAAVLARVERRLDDMEARRLRAA